MATVQSTGNAVSQQLLDAMNKKSSSANSSAQDVQDRFMTLLVTQMKNQDPLNPMDNAQVTSQMAQLSTVTGINKLNETMGALISSVQAGQSYQAASMIGRNVLSPGNVITSNGTSGGFFGVDLPVGADKLIVNIKDAGGNVVRSLNLGKQDAGVAPYSWDGIRDDGAMAAAGNYKFEVEATIGNNKVLASSLSFSQVMSVSNSANGVKLNLSNLDSVNISDVEEIF